MKHVCLTREQYRALPDEQRVREPGRYGSFEFYVLQDGEKCTFSLFDSEQHFPATLAQLGLPCRADVAYAYSPRENTGSGGKYHIVVQEPVAAGRIRRVTGETLCKRKFWGLDGGRSQIEVSCYRCLEIARKLAAATGAQTVGP